MVKPTAWGAVAALVLASCTISTVSRSSEPPVRRAIETLASDVASLNGFRTGHGLRPLARSARLQAVAEAQARHVAAIGRLTHAGPQGGNIGTRAKRHGYRYCVVAENLAMGRMTEAQVVTAWSESPQHRTNMLNREVTEYGLADLDGTYWVLVVGRSC